MNYNGCAFILVLGVDTNRLYLTGKPGQWTKQAEHGPVQVDVDQQEQAQGPISIGDRSYCILSRN
jgi:hypothetical protein